MRGYTGFLFFRGRLVTPVPLCYSLLFTVDPNGASVGDHSAVSTAISGINVDTEDLSDGSFDDDRSEPSTVCLIGNSEL